MKESIYEQILNKQNIFITKYNIPPSILLLGNAEFHGLRQYCSAVNSFPVNGLDGLYEKQEDPREKPKPIIVTFLGLTVVIVDKEPYLEVGLTCNERQ